MRQCENIKPSSRLLNQIIQMYATRWPTIRFLPVNLDRLSLNLRIPGGKQHQTLISPPNCLERNYEHCILTLSCTCRSLLVAVDGDGDTSHKLVAAQSGVSSVDVPLFRTPAITGSPCSGSISTDGVINHGHAAFSHQKSARLVQRTRGDQAYCESGQQKKRAPGHIVTVRREMVEAVRALWPLIFESLGNFQS